MPETAAVSLLVSLGCSELTGLVPGGIIVPFYFALYADDPVRIAATVVSALLSLLAVRLLSRVMILYGRRRFAAFLLCGLFLRVLFALAWFGDLYMVGRLSVTIGYLVPGILAGSMDRQGIWKTLAALCGCVLFILLARVLLA